jgi:hypothetical protein
MNTQTPLQHFLRLARRGKFPGASGGETRLWMLAEAICENAQGIDTKALDGLHEFAMLANQDYNYARQMIDS